MVFIFEWLHSQLMVTPPKPSVSFAGKTIIVTGSNTGLGKEACRWIVQLGASKIIIACRNIEKGKAAAKDIQSTTSCSANVLEVWELDLCSYPSVKAFADRAKSELARLDALLLNAGVTVRTFRIFNGNEETINTNVISCALLAFLLYPKLCETSTRFNTQPHLSVTVSEMHELAKFKERNAPPGQLFATLAEEKNFNANDRYMTSKLLEIFFVKQMAVVCPLKNNVIINAINPGFCASELSREYNFALARLIIKILGRTTEVGSRTLVAGASAGPESHGQYMADSKIVTSKGLAKEGDKAAELQYRIWVELKEKVEGIVPGVTDLN